MTPWLLLVGLAAAAPPVTVWSTDLQADDGGLVPSGDPDQWAWGTIEAGPEEGFAGPNGWATRLAQVHMNHADDRLTLPTRSLSDTTQPVLVLTHWHDLEPGDDDYGVVEFHDGITWSPVAPLDGPEAFDGESEGWRTDYFPLDRVADLSDVRLRFFADGAVARDGWVVGAVELVDGDPVPPRVSIHTAPTDTQDIPGPYPVEAHATDDVAVTDVRLVWYAGASERAEAPMNEAEPGVFTGGLPGADPGTSIVWWVEARDAAENVGIATGPTFRVYLPAPTHLQAPDGRIVDTTVPLTWTPPDTPWDITDYIVYRGGEPVASTPAPPIDAPVASAHDVFTVSARFDTSSGYFEGDQSDPVDVTAYPPTILRVAPAAAWPGDTLHIEVQGRYLLLEDGAVSLDLGSGLTVDQLEVIDVDTIEARVQVADSASPGPRTVAIDTDHHTVTAHGAFDVRTDSTRPVIRATNPAFLVRGERERLLVRTNVALPDDPRLDLGPGIVIEDAVRLDDTIARFTVSVASDAVLGDRTPELDIGTRLLSGPTVDIRAPQPAPETLCAATPRTSFGWLSLPALLALFRRRSLGRE